GWAASLAYNYASRPVTLGAAATAFSDHYTNTSLEAPADRPLLELTGLVGFPVTSRASVTLQHTYTDFRDRDVEQRSSASVSLRLTNRASLFVTALHSRPAGMESNTEVFTGLTYFLGDSTTGTLSSQVSRDQNTGTVEVQRSLPLGTGYGYRVQASRLERDVPATAAEGSDRTVEYNGLAIAQHQSRYGFYEASYQRSDDRNSTMLTAAAGVVAIGGGVHLSRPVQDGFALIDVGVPGVRGYLNNQEIGRTGSRGKLLVPNLLPYYGNRLGIADQDIPIDYSISTTERMVAPPVRGGSVVSFPARRIQAFVGHVLMEIPGRTVTPSYGQLTVTADGQTYESPIGRDGEFYLESLPPGRHPAMIEHKEGTCRFTLEAPPSPASLVEVGTARCPGPGPERGPR
ncbi:MAG: fimbria/pilus outer membrane usher protein, partial [Candidatus Rokuibacteriota bacterium]